MHDTVFYMRGHFPFGVEPPLSDSAVRDAKVVLELSADDADAIRSELEKYPGFLDRAKLQSLLFGRISDETRCEALARFIVSFNERLRATGGSIDDLVRQFEEWLDNDEGQPQIIRKEQLPELRLRLQSILSPFPCLARQAKAERLTTVIGHPLESIEIICDVRPVFDQNRDSIEGMIPYTSLRIVCKGADGLPISMETILSEKDVHKLADAAQKAKTKLSRIHELLTEKRIEVPTTELTKREPTDAN